MKIKVIIALLVLSIIVFGALTYSNVSAKIDSEKVKSIALQDANVQEATFHKVNLKNDDGKVVYEVEFYKGNVEYDYEIDAKTGAIIEKDRDIENFTTPQATSTNQNISQNITAEKAKSIALQDANVQEATFHKVNLKNDDGKVVYEVEFYKGNVEYDYEIDAKTGAIIEKDRDIENFTAPQATTSQVITAEKAKSIAFKQANVAANKVYNLEVKLDNDDGRKVYEIDFDIAQTEYSYTIDTQTGKILEYSKER